MYVGSNDNYLYALDAITGNLKWKYKTESSVKSSPAVSGGVVYVGSGSSIYAFAEQGDQINWSPGSTILGILLEPISIG